MSWYAWTGLPDTCCLLVQPRLPICSVDALARVAAVRKSTRPTTTASEPAGTPPVEQGQPAPVAVVDQQNPERCSIRMTARGIMVDGELMKREHAVVLCKQRSVALVEVSDDAKQGVVS